MLTVLPVVMLVAAAAVLIGVIVVAMGRGGELAFFQADYAPLKLDQVSSTDVALFRPPTALWGYSMQPTDEAFTRIAAAITERDIEIAALQQQVADLESFVPRRGGYGPPSEPLPRVEPDPRPKAESGPMPRAESGPMPRAESGPMPRAVSEPPTEPRPRVERMARAAEPSPRDDQLPTAQEPPPAARSVWEPPPRPMQGPMQGSGEAGDTAQWAALPKRTPAPGAQSAQGTQSDEDEQ
jgi:hypothetical protein